MTKGMGWPIGVALILATTVAANIGVIVFTRDDPSFSVEPDYYRKAVEWDSLQAAEDRSDALAWHVAAHVAPQDGGASELRLDLTDMNGQPVRNASLSGELLHIARANDVQQVQFSEQADGRYAATVPMTRAGIWELRLVADRRGAGASADTPAEHFMQTVRIDTQTDGAVPLLRVPPAPHGP
jgi:nitrogen fixation protein FixH